MRETGKNRSVHIASRPTPAMRKSRAECSLDHGAADDFSPAARYQSVSREDYSIFT